MPDWSGDIVGSIDGRDVGPWYTTQIPNAPDIESLSIGNDVTALGFNAFADCFGLLHATIPNSVTTLAEAAFANCKNLQSIVIPNSVTRIDRRAFMSCESLISIVIPNTITTISEYMLAHCYILPSITIPDNVTSIEEGAFWGDYTFSSFTFPAGIRSLEKKAFYGCSNCELYDFRKSTSVPTLVNVNAFQNTPSNKEIIVPDALYNQWISASNWSSTSYNIRSNIV